MLWFGSCSPVLFVQGGRGDNGPHPFLFSNGSNTMGSAFEFVWAALGDASNPCWRFLLLVWFDG